jgi:hypothetical protein
MRRSSWTPSIVPGGYNQTVYLVADDFGRIGRAWREADYEGTDQRNRGGPRWPHSYREDQLFYFATVAHRLNLAQGLPMPWKHESGTYVKFTQAGADLFA